MVDYKGTLCYLFSIKPKEDLGFFKSDRVVVDQMNTWFDLKTLEVLGRNYALSYKAGVYDFDVAMEVEMTKFKGLTVPKTLRYKGNWDVVFKKGNGQYLPLHYLITINGLGVTYAKNWS